MRGVLVCDKLRLTAVRLKLQERSDVRDAAGNQGGDGPVTQRHTADKLGRGQEKLKKTSSFHPELGGNPERRHRGGWRQGCLALWVPLHGN